MLGADWMNQQIFLKPWILSNFFLLLVSHYSCTWESSLQWLCQFTQFSFISQFLSNWLLITCYWISFPSCYVKYTYLFRFSLESTWFPAAFDSADTENICLAFTTSFCLESFIFLWPFQCSNSLYHSIPIHSYFSFSYLSIFPVFSYTASLASFFLKSTPLFS